MAETQHGAGMVDDEELGTHQTVDLREGGEIWIHDNATFQDIKLDAQAATQLMDFLLLHGDRLHRHAQEAQKIVEYNKAMDERNRIIRESVEKPWLPLHDGE